MLYSLPQIRLSSIYHIKSSLMLFAYYRKGCGPGKALGSNLGGDEELAKNVLSILEWF